MAAEKNKAPEVFEEAVTAEQEPKPVEAKPAESVYTAAELTAAYKAFNVPREIVAVALRLAGKKTATFKEAQTIVGNFKNKEVK